MSHRTQLEMISTVENVDEELDRIEEEKKEAQTVKSSAIDDAFGDGGVNGESS